MKHIVFIGLMLLSTPVFGMQFIRDQFCMGPVEQLTYEEKVKQAIEDANVKQVQKLVTATNATPDELQGYIKMASNNIGITPKSDVKGKFIGSLRLVLGLTMFYKACDYFTKAYVVQCSKNPSAALSTMLVDRYSSVHELAMDVASIGSFLSAYGTCTFALRTINPKSDFNNQLLIKLYLKDLAQTAH